MKTFTTTVALMGASAAASSIGSAHVVNKCSYDVTLCNVPSAGGGFDQQETTLKPGQAWNQSWTELTNGNGWSIKLSKDKIIGGNILQYEYTFHNDGIIWYDLSCVDGNPWDKDWEITATGSSCSPKQQAYRYSTDDAYGMQSCGQDASITVTLCTGLSADNGTAVEVSSSAAAAYVAPTPLAVVNEKAAAASPTTFATSTTPAAVVPVVMNGGGVGAVTVTEVATAYVTNIVTAYERRHLRHEHGHRA